MIKHVKMIVVKVIKKYEETKYKGRNKISRMKYHPDRGCRIYAFSINRRTSYRLVNTQVLASDSHSIRIFNFTNQ